MRVFDHRLKTDRLVAVTEMLNRAIVGESEVRVVVTVLEGPDEPVHPVSIQLSDPEYPGRTLVVTTKELVT